MSRDFVPIYSHHLSAVIILFIIGLLKPSLRSDMMGEIRGSLEVFRAVAQPDHDMYARVGPKGYGVIRSMIQVCPHVLSFHPVIMCGTQRLLVRRVPRRCARVTDRLFHA